MGVHYHVMARTIHQIFLFQEPEIKEWVYKHILELASLYYVDLHAVTIMDNHYHTVLSVREPEFDEVALQERFERAHERKRYPPKWYEWRARGWYNKLTDLSEFMKELNQSVARHINQKLGKKGHVWGERFKSVLIEDGPGLLACMAYVALNPVRAGICERAEDYRWCSVGRYLQGGENASGMVFPQIGSFGKLKAEYHQKAFCMLVNHIADEEHGKQGGFTCDIAELEALIQKMDVSDLLNLTLRRTRWIVDSIVLGSQSFCSKIIEKFRLQSGNGRGPTPYDVGNGLFNSHRRAGPFLS